jgi:hypothetical protein
LTRIFDTTRERRTAAETDARRSRKAQIDRVRRRLNVLHPKDGDLIDLKNILKAIVDIMADDGEDE